MKYKSAIAILAVAAALSILSAYAYTAGLSLTQQITYTKSNMAISWEEQATVTYTGVDTIVKTYTITNAGNVPCDVTPSIVITPSGSSTAAWSKTTATLDPAQSTTFTLTLTVVADGSATVTFTASPATV